MLNDLKEFEKFLKICRKYGVTDVTHDGIIVRLGDLPQRAGEQEQSDDIPTDGPTEEELAFMHIRNIAGQR